MPDYLTIAEAGRALRRGEVTSRQLVEAAFAAADVWEPELGVFLARFDETALAAADAADAELAAGTDRGPLHGVPLGIKDIIATEEGPTTAQSLILEPDWYGPGDAPVVARLRKAGGVVVGKTTTCEYAIGFPDPEKPFPIPRNPWDLNTWPGGSSSGTGGGVPAGMFLGGLGTDTGGSIRMPAAYCGITGLKGTFGRVPKSGCVPLGYSLDGIGPMARSAEDCALMLSVMAGADPDDPMSSDVPVDDYAALLGGDLTGVRIGVDSLDRHSPQTDPAWPGLFADALDMLRAAGATVEEVELPLWDELGTVQLLIMAAEAAAYHLPDLQTRWADYGAGARWFIGTGTGYTAADYVQAQRVRRLGQKRMAALMTKFDLIVTPTSTMPSPQIGDLDPLNPMQSLTGLHTFYWNPLGNPTISVPVGFTDAGLPMGMQIAGRPFADAEVLRVADVYQRQTDFHLRRPALPSSAAAA